MMAIVLLWIIKKKAHDADTIARIVECKRARSHVAFCSLEVRGGVISPIGGGGGAPGHPVLIWTAGGAEPGILSVDLFCFVPLCDLTGDVKWLRLGVVLLGPWPLWCTLCRRGDWTA